MFDFIHDLPLRAANAGEVILFIIVLIVTWIIPKSFIFSGAPDTRRWRDLRIWATVLIMVQFVIYYIF